MIPPLVGSVEVLRPYVVRVTFEDGAVREVDMEPTLGRGGAVYGPLRDPDVFAQVEVIEGRESICWPTGADIDPDVLYGLAESDSQPGPRVEIPQQVEKD